MHLLYLDESGCVSDPQQRHFVLGGLSIFERSTHWIEQELNQLRCVLRAIQIAPTMWNFTVRRCGRAEMDGMHTAFLRESKQSRML